MSELIAAIATPPGPGGVGILRLSGPGAAQAAAHIFQPLGKTPLSEAPDRQLLYGRVFDQAGDLLDTGAPPTATPGRRRQRSNATAPPWSSPWF